MGYVLLLVFMSMHAGGHSAMIELGIRQGNAGHVVVQVRAYQQARAVELLVAEPEAVRSALRRAAPEADALLRVSAAG